LTEPKIVEVTPSLYTYGGEVMGRLADGRAVFIPFALPGERVRIRLVEDKRRYARGELLEIIEPSPERVAPRCPHFQVCGGCHYQHLPYESQLALKAEVLQDQLARIGGLKDVHVAPTVPSPRPFNYRNHIQFHQAPDGALGFQAARSNQVVAVQECHLPEAPIDALWPQLQLEPLPGLDRVGVRVGADEELQLILESSDPQAFEFSVEDLPISAVHLGPGGTIVLAGSEALAFEVLGRTFQVSAGSFFQVNTPQAAAMVEHLLGALPLENSPTVLDVYCGVGLFSAFLAERAGRLVGIESNPDACGDFATNLDEFDHVELYEALAAEVLGSVDFQPDIVVVDPPRTGLGREALDGLLAQEAGWIAYISCDPSTLARDAKRMGAGGYELVQITPFDLFPQTFHIESISIWRKNP
jgi:23S rRNA (uracil1939-C5)-methyltransferase